MNEVLPGIILACTLRGTILIAFAVMAGPWARRFLGRNGAHWLWLAVLPALLWPLPPRTALSFQNLWSGKKGAPLAEIANPDVPKEAADAMPVAVKVRAAESKEPEAAGDLPKGAMPNENTMRIRPSPMAAIGRWLMGLWLCGAVVALGHLCWRWRGTVRMLSDAQPVSDDRVAAFLRRFAAGRRVSVALVSSVRAPALAGIWRPRILIPNGWLEELPASELESVLLHELGHHLRGDLVWEWAFAIARCLHWMNPAVWLAERMARYERELACDAWALERSAHPAQYGEALLEALKRVHRCAAASFGVAAMADDARQIARRLKWISRYRPSPRWLAGASWAPALLVLAAVGSDPLVAGGERKETPPAKQGSEDRSPGAARSESPADEPLPLAKRSVEVTTLLIRVPESMAKQLGWPVAEKEAAGVQRIVSLSDFRKSLAALRSAPGVEFIPTPRLVSRSGSEGVAEMAREFRFGLDYKTSADGLPIPASVESSPLGLTLKWKADIKDENTVHLKLEPELNRLRGFVESNGNLTKAAVPPAGANWQQRLVAYEMPVGAGGAPEFLLQRGEADLDLTSKQVAIIFGFRDADETAVPGGSKGENMVLYFAVQTGILQ